VDTSEKIKIETKTKKRNKKQQQWEEEDWRSRKSETRKSEAVEKKRREYEEAAAASSILFPCVLGVRFSVLVLLLLVYFSISLFASMCMSY